MIVVGRRRPDLTECCVSNKVLILVCTRLFRMCQPAVLLACMLVALLLVLKTACKRKLSGANVKGRMQCCRMVSDRNRRVLTAT